MRKWNTEEQNNGVQSSSAKAEPGDAEEQLRGMKQKKQHKEGTVRDEDKGGEDE